MVENKPAEMIIPAILFLYLKSCFDDAVEMGLCYIGWKMESPDNQIYVN